MTNKTNKTKLFPRSVTRAGFSYVEVLLAALIMSVLLVASVRLFGNLGRSRQAVNDGDTAAYLALEMIQAIKQLPYHDCDEGNDEFGPGTDEMTGSRAVFDDADDYHNWSANPPQDHNGNPYNNYRDLTRSVIVRYVAPNDFTITSSDNQGFEEFTITVSRDKKILAQQIYVIAQTDDCLN